MTNKRCLVFETLGKVSDLQVVENKGNNEMRLSGVFGVCGVKNQNNRVYDRDNYAQMVESLQKVIATEGCPGELEHPNSMNINLENVSHKIESIEIDEQGVITGTILLLNTPKGQIAKAIVEGGLPLYISSRGCGTITNEGRVTLSTIKTYDLVGTPGFSQAKLSLKENQTIESLNESLDDGNISWAIVESDDDEAKDELLDKDEPKDEPKDKKEEEPKEAPKEDKSDDDEEDTKNKDKKKEINMDDLMTAIDELTKKVESLEAELHVAQESLSETQKALEDANTAIANKKDVNYDAIEEWLTSEFSEDMKSSIKESMKEWTLNEYSNIIEKWIDTEFRQSMTDWIVEKYSPNVQNWIVEEFGAQITNWVNEEVSKELENKITESLSPKFQNWVTEEFAPEIQEWLTEEYSPVVEKWVTEEFAPENNKIVTEKINESVQNFLESRKAARLEEIDSLLESIESNNEEVEKLVKESNEKSKYAGLYVIENMPSQYSPSWEMLDETRKEEIIRSSRMYDFTKPGVLESFWNNVDFSTKTEEVNETKNDVFTEYHSSIAQKMRSLRK